MHVYGCSRVWGVQIYVQIHIHVSIQWRHKIDSLLTLRIGQDLKELKVHKFWLVFLGSEHHKSPVSASPAL